MEENIFFVPKEARWETIAAFKFYTLSAMDETMRIVGIREFKCT